MKKPMSVGVADKPTPLHVHCASTLRRLVVYDGVRAARAPCRLERAETRCSQLDSNHAQQDRRENGAQNHSIGKGWERDNAEAYMPEPHAVVDTCLNEILCELE